MINSNWEVRLSELKPTPARGSICSAPIVACPSPGLVVQHSSGKHSIAAQTAGSIGVTTAYRFPSVLSRGTIR